MIEPGEFFIVTRLHRDDLLFSLSSEDRMKYNNYIEKIPDDYMQQIADSIADALCESGVYWDVINNYLDEMKREWVCHCCGANPCTCELDSTRDDMEVCNQRVCTYWEDCLNGGMNNGKQEAEKTA